MHVLRDKEGVKETCGLFDQNKPQEKVGRELQSQGKTSMKAPGLKMSLHFWGKYEEFFIYKNSFYRMNKRKR